MYSQPLLLYIIIIRSSSATSISDQPERKPSTDPMPNVNIVSNGYFWPAEVRSTTRRLYYLVSSIDWEQLLRAGPRRMLGHCVRECKIVPISRPRVFRRRHWLFLSFPTWRVPKRSNWILYYNMLALERRSRLSVRYLRRRLTSYTQCKLIR